VTAGLISLESLLAGGKKLRKKSAAIVARRLVLKPGSAEPDRAPGGIQRRETFEPCSYSVSPDEKIGLYLPARVSKYDGLRFRHGFPVHASNRSIVRRLPSREFGIFATPERNVVFDIMILMKE